MLNPLALLLVPFALAPAKLPGQSPVVPSAGPDREIALGQVADLTGSIEGLTPLDYWVADGNGEQENMLVRYHEHHGTSAVGPMRRTTGQLMGWTGDLVRIEDRVYGIDVGARHVFVADLEGGFCLPVTPKLDGRWTGLQSLAYDSEGNTLYLVDLTSGQLLEIERGTGDIRVIKAPDLNGRKGIRSLAFDQELGLLFAADNTTNLLLVIDPETGTLADMMSLPENPLGHIEELCFFQGELFAMVGMVDAEGQLNNGQLQRIDLHSGFVANVGPVITDVSPHALLINSVPEQYYWAQVGGPAVAQLEYTTLLETSARFPEPGRYEFALTVLTREGPVSDRVAVVVREPAQE